MNDLEESNVFEEWALLERQPNASAYLTPEGKVVWLYFNDKREVIRVGYDESGWSV